MNRILTVLLFAGLLSGCEKAAHSKTPDMEAEARNTVMEYLAKNDLPNVILPTNDGHSAKR
jgi:outer membrane PBP1 activator LpoA protein